MDVSQLRDLLRLAGLPIDFEWGRNATYTQLSRVL